MRWGAPDRVPYFEEGIRADALRAWRGQGLGRKSEFAAMFRHDRREELHPDLEPLPRLQHWPSGRGGVDLDVLRRDKETIRREVEAKVPPLLAEGG
jgi:hypothetical protein